MLIKLQILRNICLIIKIFKNLKQQIWEVKEIWRTCMVEAKGGVPGRTEDHHGVYAWSIR